MFFCENSLTLFTPAQGFQAKSSVSHPPCLATAGTTRCLIVFIKFKSDSFGKDLNQPGAECVQDSLRSWRWEVNSLPPFAHQIIDSTTDSHPTPGSLTDYFFQMSAGRFHLIGEIYPKLIIPWFEESYYFRQKGRGLAWLNRKILETIDPHVHFQRYDNNPRDGQVDLIILLYRFFSSEGLDGAHYQGKAFLGGFSPFVCDSVQIDGRVFGSGITTECYKFTGVKLIAHEIGHYLFGSGHRHGIGAFGLMGNAGYSTMCAREREILGWVTPKIITASVFNDTLKDLTTTGQIRKIWLNDQEYLLLANRQRISFFEQLIDEPCKQGELPAAGLVLTHVWGNQPDQFRIIAADGKITAKGDSTDVFAPARQEILNSNHLLFYLRKKQTRIQFQIQNLRCQNSDLIYNIIIENQ